MPSSNDARASLVVAVEVLQTRALQVRRKFAALERESFGEEWTTSDLMSGFVVDVGDLTRLVMAAEGLRQIDNVEEKVAHELADCLWAVLVLADRLGVDLGRAFGRVMQEVETFLDAELQRPYVD